MIPINLAKYKDFTREWYYTVGDQVLAIFLLNILLNLISPIFYSFKNCCCSVRRKAKNAIL